MKEVRKRSGMAEPVHAGLGTVEEAMSRPVVAFPKGTKASDVAAALHSGGVAGGPVIDGERVIGVISERDLLERARSVVPSARTTGPFLRYEDVLATHFPDLTVDELMTSPAETVRADWPLALALLTIDSAGVNRLPVVDRSGILVGILARDDVIAALARWVRRQELPKIPPD